MPDNDKIKMLDRIYEQLHKTYRTDAKSVRRILMLDEQVETLLCLVASELAIVRRMSQKP